LPARTGTGEILIEGGIRWVRHEARLLGPFTSEPLELGRFPGEWAAVVAVSGKQAGGQTGRHETRGLNMSYTTRICVDRPLDQVVGIVK
jgi:hypothetical protein